MLADGFGHTRRGGSAAGAILAAALAAAPAHAQGSDRWAAHEEEASAALPAQPNERISGAVLSCAAERWTLRLEIAAGTLLAEGGAELRVDGSAFAVEPVAERGGLTIAVPRGAIAPLKEGLRLEIDLSGPLEEAVGDAVFSLIGSRIAIGAVEERCSRRDMSAYRPVTFTPYSSYINLVRELRAADIRAFSDATTAQPEASAAMLELGEGRRLLFTRLCGSSWYYGISGCNITGFAPDGGETGWRAVYDTENVLVHTDPESAAQGWPDLVTQPVRAGGLELVWRWDGRAYALHGELPEAPQPAPLPLRTGHD